MTTDRAQKAQSDLNHTKDMLTEEQERYIKVEVIKKSLEVEIRSLHIRIEEIETNALVGGKRALAKLETRVSESLHIYMCVSRWVKTNHTSQISATRKS